MPPRIRVDTTQPTPIWSQLEAALHRQIVTGQLAPGAPVPSVRDLARELRINPATVAKAYQRLCDQGLLETRRGEGSFVATSPPVMTRTERARALREAALRYATSALSLGIARDEAQQELLAAWPATRKGEGR
jgi:GntR family transcriptional regulator